MEEKEDKQDNIRSITLRVAIFFGLTTFTLCIGIFYIETVLDSTQDLVLEKDSVITTLRSDLTSQEEMIRENEHEIKLLQSELKEMREEDLSE